MDKLRVLKPGGSIYLDAAIHLHGNEMFIMGDMARILSYFPEQHWCNIQIERWRYHYQPLQRHAPNRRCLMNGNRRSPVTARNRSNRQNSNRSGYLPSPLKNGPIKYSSWITVD